MFGYLATRDPEDASNSVAAVSYLAQKHSVPPAKLNSVQLADFRIDFFDSGKMLTCYQDQRYVMLLMGSLLNKEAVQAEVHSESENDAELMLDLYSRGTDALSKFDGHLSFIMFDAVEKTVTLMADRFLRFSVLYSVDRSVRVASHTSLLYPFLADKSVDPDAFSQSVHFRWLTGERKLFRGIKQVLPGALLSIDDSGAAARSQYFRLAFDRQERGNLEYWVDQVDAAFDRCLSKIARRHDVVAVPLSGGVDSSLLLAKAREHCRDCVAVTARFLNGDNPELDNARYVAKELGVRHIVADIDDAFIREMFPIMIGLQEQPPRNYSDFALARIFRALSGDVDAFLYGESADTFFGSKAVRLIAATDKDTAALRQLPRAAQQLLARLIPGHYDRLRRAKVALESGIDDLILSMDRIKHATPPSRVFNCTDELPKEGALVQYLAHDRLPTVDRVSIQVLATGVMNHIENTGRLASYFGLQMYAPFVLQDVREVAQSLPIERQYGNGEVKPVLRELACRYLDRDYIYADKHGFPTPTKNWLNGPLKERVQSSIDGSGAANEYYSHESLSTLSMDRDLPHFWYAICMDELFSQLGCQPIRV